MDVVESAPKVPLLKQRARMGQGMHLDGHAFGQPFLGLGVVGLEGVGENAYRCPPVDFFKPFKNGSQKCLVFLRSSHVIDTQSDDGFHPYFADPLRGSQFREIAMGMKRVAPFHVGESIGRALGDMGSRPELMGNYQQ